MTKSYEIATIRDMLMVPTERRADMLAELELALGLMEFSFGDEGCPDILSFTWTDDNDPSVSLHDQDGRKFLSLEVTK